MKWKCYPHNHDVWQFTRHWIIYICRVLKNIYFTFVHLCMGIWCHVFWYICTDVLEEHAASTFGLEDTSLTGKIGIIIVTPMFMWQMHWKYCRGWNHRLNIIFPYKSIPMSWDLPQRIFLLLVQLFVENNSVHPFCAYYVCHFSINGYNCLVW